MKTIRLRGKVQADSWDDLYGEQPTDARASTCDIEITITGEVAPPPPDAPQPPSSTEPQE
jgi:hypothetical protein